MDGGGLILRPLKLTGTVLTAFVQSVALLQKGVGVCRTGCCSGCCKCQGSLNCLHRLQMKCLSHQHSQSMLLSSQSISKCWSSDQSENDEGDDSSEDGGSDLEWKSWIALGACSDMWYEHRIFALKNDRIFDPVEQPKYMGTASESLQLLDHEELFAGVVFPSPQTLSIPQD